MYIITSYEKIYIQAKSYLCTKNTIQYNNTFFDKYNKYIFHTYKKYIKIPVNMPENARIESE